MENYAIEVNNLSMEYRVASEKVDNLKEYVIKMMKKELHHSNFSALDNIDFKVKHGQKVGIIGRNGAGKSTLLKIIAGVMKPTDGTVNVNGKVAPMLELGAGFDSDFTGRENIYFNGAILGKKKDELKSIEGDIVEYADLGRFIDVPLKNYSSGMRARLGFAVATQIDPDILILDEILGVGDRLFKQKSKQSILDMVNDGRTILLVTHNLQEAVDLTETTVWLEKGKIKAMGPSKDICEQYEQYYKV